MYKLLEKWSSYSLIARIVAGLILGTILGLVAPNIFGFVSFFGTLFVGALKGIAPILVFFLVMSAIAQHKEGSQTNMKHIIALYVISTIVAALVAVAASFMFPTELILADIPESTAPPGGIGEVVQALLLNAVANPINALYNGNYIGILVTSLLFGITLKNANASTKQMISDFSDATSTIVRWVIQLAPFGIMGLIFSTVSEGGLGTLLVYSKLLGVLVGSMLFCAFVTNPIIVYLNIKQNPYPLVFRCIRQSGITAFFTRSSAANIPVNMQLCEELGLDKDTYAVSIPLGATINMDGAEITINVLTLSAAYTVGIQVDFLMDLLHCIVASVIAFGDSGVAGGSLLLIPLACSLFGIPNDVAMQVVGVGFIVGVLQDSCETALNSSSDVLLTATADIAKRKKAGETVNIK
ncbi:MAG: serine/threonine transporter SstT [Lachnospirales bacterium]